VQQASEAGVGAAMAYKAMAMAVCDPPSADRNAAVQRNLLKATNSQEPVALYIMVRPPPPLLPPPNTRVATPQTRIVTSAFVAALAPALATPGRPHSVRGCGSTRMLVRLCDACVCVPSSAQGLCVLRGVGGLSRNPVTARGWFMAAANKHHRTALYQLGTLAEVGLAGPVDLALAEQFYRRGAELGSDHAGVCGGGGGGGGRGVAGWTWW
jgi:hypothetical protein